MPHDLLQPNYDVSLEKKSRAETLLSECSLQEKVLLKVLVNYIDQNNVSEAGIRKYILRRNMFYRIRDNKLDSLD